MCFSLERQHENCVLEGEIHEGKESKSPRRTGFYFLSLGVASSLTRSISPVKFLTISSLDPVTSFSKSPLCFTPYCVLWEASNIGECVNLQQTAGKEGSEAAHSPSDAARGVWNTFKRLRPEVFRHKHGCFARRARPDVAAPRPPVGRWWPGSSIRTWKDSPGRGPAPFPMLLPCDSSLHQQDAVGGKGRCQVASPRLYSCTLLPVGPL